MPHSQTYTLEVVKVVEVVMTLVAIWIAALTELCRTYMHSDMCVGMRVDTDMGTDMCIDRPVHDSDLVAPGHNYMGHNYVCHSYLYRPITISRPI